MNKNNITILYVNMSDKDYNLKLKFIYRYIYISFIILF